jgi:hypothetical protein
MPRKRNAVPTLPRHKAKQLGYVKLHGNFTYLGHWPDGLEEPPDDVWENYQRVVSEHRVRGGPALPRAAGPARHAGDDHGRRGGGPMAGVGGDLLRPPRRSADRRAGQLPAGPAPGGAPLRAHRRGGPRPAEAQGGPRPDGQRLPPPITRRPGTLVQVERQRPRPPLRPRLAVGRRGGTGPGRCVPGAQGGEGATQRTGRRTGPPRPASASRSTWWAPSRPRSAR